MRSIITAVALLAPLAFTAAAFASQPATDDSASTQLLPVSTGVKSASVLSSVKIELPYESKVNVTSHSEVVVDLNVGIDGKASNVKIVKSPSLAFNEPVLTAVRQFRFEPGTVSNQLVSTPLTLTVVLQR